MRDKVVEPQDLVHAVLAFPTGVDDFDGVITVERAAIDTTSGTATGFDAPVQTHTVRYRGLALATMAVEFTAPAMRGVYRVALRDNAAAAPASFDELIVQQP